jgi:hypothetical protein
MTRCELCGYEVTRALCPSCELYNAAVAAQNAAAKAIARARQPHAINAFLNEHGVFAYLDGGCIQLATAEEAAPFAALTTAARVVTSFWRGQEV